MDDTERKSYEAYKQFQAKTARDTADRTLEFRHYPRILQLIKAYFPNAQSLLLIGCRHPSEYDFFREHYMDVTAIDLFDEGPIVNCDMSKIDMHPTIGSRQYDVFVSIRSLAHCMDLDGFVEGLRAFATQGMYCFTKAGFQRNDWFCSDADILKLTASPAMFQETFSPFQLPYLQYVWNGEEYNIEFVLRR